MDEPAELSNIRVVVRVRPAQDKTKTEAVTCGDQLEVDCGDGKRFTGAFADILGPAATQNDVYRKVEDVVLQTTEGINACVMAYGQTGAGKTHTMLGDNDGIIPKALNALFDKLGSDEPPTPVAQTPAPRAAKVSVSLLQILGEKLEDLLSPSSEIPLRVRLASRVTDELYVSGLSSIVVDDAEAALKVVNRGLKGRRERSTKRNDASSRSHAVLRVDIEKTDDVEVVKSRLYLVDLAGSERASALEDDAEGSPSKMYNPSETQRFKEHVDINRSLSALGNVVSALSDGPTKRPHVPYRDSTLTRLLQDSLGGNTRTAIVACCAPESIYADESVSTLKFADRAQRVLARVYANRDVVPSASDATLATALKKAKDEIRRLKEALRSASPVKPPSFVKQMQLVDVTKSLQAEVAALRAENEQLRKLLDPQMAASVKAVPSADMVSRTSPRKKKKQRGRPPRPSSQPDDVSITQFQQRLEKLDTVVGPRPTSAARASSDSLAAEAAKLEEKAASKMLAERQAQVEEELSQDEAEFERIRREREELERQLAEMEAVDEPPPPQKTPPRPQRRRRRRKPAPAPIVQSPPPEEPTAILYGDMRDVGGRVEVFSFRFNRAYAGDVVSYDPKRGLHCVAYDDGEKKWHDLFDKSIKCLKAGNGRETPPEAPPSTTPLSLSHALARRGGPRRRPRRKKKLTNNPVAATGYVTTSPCKGSEMLPQLGEMYGPGRGDAVGAF
uniref:Kinesin-like protein n=1 Tax=Pelagomonas calceolata TaxID=35677 RepID=A0A7S3ZT40_9STRA|mmetsp:Transcript_17270/g.49309  ORF Transcript_17270/g.49309 Transcript_17270/m.49309 type:complete len:731 (-) Transcript_17270:24-2216(-)